MKCRFAESAQLSRKLLEDDPPPAENTPADDFSFGADDEQMLDTALAGIPNYFKWFPADYSDWQDKLGNRTQRKLENNTYVRLERYPTEHIALRLHQTDILKVYPDGSFVVDNGGWQKMTTMRRLNNYLPPGWSIYTHQGTWYWCVNGKGMVWDRNPEGRVVQEYSNGDRVDAEGVLHAKAKARRMKPIRTRQSRPRRDFGLPPQ